MEFSKLIVGIRISSIQIKNVLTLRLHKDSCCWIGRLVNISPSNPTAEESGEVLATVQIRDERSAGMLESCLLESEKNPV